MADEDEDDDDDDEDEDEDEEDVDDEDEDDEDVSSKSFVGESSIKDWWKLMLNDSSSSS